jgi:hypothetical protein
VVGVRHIIQNKNTRHETLIEVATDSAKKWYLTIFTEKNNLSGGQVWWKM